MFAKEKSSTWTVQKKKAKDVPLRKSDRRKLLDTVVDTLAKHMAGADDATTSAVVETLQASPLLQDIFLQGTLVKRDIILFEDKSGDKATLYFKSPNAPSKDATEASSSSHEDASLTRWPYTQLTQAVWFQVDAGNPRDPPWQIPTVALLSVLRHSPAVSWASTVRVHPQVSHYLGRGAHLMKAGMRNLPPPAVLKATNHVVLIQAEGNPQPFAVGILHASLTSSLSTNAIGTGAQGVGVMIYTCYGDDVWLQQLPPAMPNNKSSSSKENRNGWIVSPWGGAPFDEGDYGNVGFVKGQQVAPITSTASEGVEGTGKDDKSEEEEAPQLSDEKTNTAPVESVETDPALATGAQGETSATVPVEEAASLAEPTGTEAQGVSLAPAGRPEPELSPDQVLHMAFCKALAHLSAKRDLPMTMAQFYSQHVLAHRPPNTTVLLKQTTFKKLGNYIKEQVENGLVTVKADAKSGDKYHTLTGYDPRHADIRLFVQERKEKQAQSNENAASSSEPQRLVLADLYAVPHHFTNLLRLDPAVVQAKNATSVERQGTGLLTLKEVRAILDDYLQREELVDDVNKNLVHLDGPLTDALFKKSKKQQQGATTVPTTLSRQELSTSWLGKLENAYCLVAMPGNRVLQLARGKPPHVRIEVQQRQAKKFVTKLRGMEDYSVDANHLQSEIARRFACAVSINEESTIEKLAKNRVELVLQGNWVDELESLLLGDPRLTSHGGAKDSPYRLPKNAIQVVLGKNVPARRSQGGGKKRK